MKEMIKWFKFRRVTYVTDENGDIVNDRFGNPKQTVSKVRMWISERSKYLNFYKNHFNYKLVSVREFESNKRSGK